MATSLELQVSSSTKTSFDKNEVPAVIAGTFKALLIIQSSNRTIERKRNEKLRSAALTVAVHIVFFVLALAALFGLAGLTALLSGLATLLTLLSGLATLLALT
jgi:hypothetical protein